MIVHRTIQNPAWWIFGAGLAFAAWWGLPLIQSAKLENHFYGLFWYSMLLLGAAIWAVPAEQRATNATLQRHYRLFGCWTLWKQVQLVSAFTHIELEQDSAPFRRDSVWVIFKMANGQSWVFARFTDSQRGIAKAEKLVADLVALTGVQRSVLEEVVQPD